MFVTDVKCLQAAWQTVPNSRTGSSKAVLDLSKHRSYFSPFVDRSSPSYVGMRSTDCSLPTSCFALEMFAIKTQKCLKLHRNFDAFGPPFFSLGELPNF